MRNSTKMGGTIKKKYQSGGKVNNGRKGVDPKMSIDTFKKGTGKDMRMSPSKIQVGTTKPMTPAEKAKRMEDFMKMSPKKKMGGAKKYQTGGAIIASPIDGPRRRVAGSNMAKGGQKFPDLTGDGKVTKKDILKGRGVIKKKGGMTAYEKSSYDKAMDAKGAHGKEGSKKDKAADKKAASSMGYMKKGGAANPGFKAVQAKIAAKQGVSKKAAGAILASSTRKASAKAKAANPRLRRVKG